MVSFDKESPSVLLATSVIYFGTIFQIGFFFYLWPRISLTRRSDRLGIFHRRRGPVFGDGGPALRFGWVHDHENDLH